MQDTPANAPATVIGFVNVAHFIDHYAMLVFAAAVIVIAPAFGMGYGELLPYATPGFVAFGAGSLAAGVWGNLGVASSALVTGLVCHYLGWRWAFVFPLDRPPHDSPRPLSNPSS